MEEVARDLIAPPSEEEDDSDDEEEDEENEEGDKLAEKDSINKYRYVTSRALTHPYSIIPGAFWLISRKRSLGAKTVQLVTWKSLGRMGKKTLLKMQRKSR